MLSRVSTFVLRPLMAIVVLALAMPLTAQVPTTLSYQGRLLTNDATQGPASGTVDIDFSIWSDATGGTELWTESWTGVSLSNGVFSVLLGSNGSPLDPADFQGDTSLFLQLVIDGETLTPRQQLGSAPFAFVDEPANELQDLELSGNTLSLSGDATSVDLSGFVDTDNQDLSLTGDTLSLTGDATPVDLSTYLDNTDAQTLSLVGDTITLSGSGSSVDLSGVTTLAGLLDLVETLDARRTVFVSSQRYDGDLGGLSGADAACQSLADAAGLPGVFAAWLSDATESPSTRFTRFGSFALVDGTRVADDWGDLTDGTLQNAIDLDENGAPGAGSPSVWTNTGTDGTVFGADHCTNWSSADSGFAGRAGSRVRVDAGWTGDAVPFCDQTQQLYCFQQSLTVADDQQLTLVGNNLELTGDSGTTSVNLSPFLDNTDDQALSISGDTLRLTSDDGTDTVDLSTYLDNTDAQDLSLLGSTLSLTGDATSVDLSSFTNTDNQVLSISSDTLQLTSDDGTDTVDLAPYLDNTDAQDLSLLGSTLSLTGDATSVDLSGFANTDAQTLSLTGDTLEISGSGSTVDLSTSDSIAMLLARLEALENAVPYTVFATSIGFDGNLGGLAGADESCQSLANAAGLTGQFKAWLSDTSDSPSTRFTQGDRPYALVTGTRIADDWADLIDGTLDAPIDRTETGVLIETPSVVVVWTNTTASGTVLSTTDHCSDWTAATVTLAGNGRVDRTNSEWTDAGPLFCSVPGNRLYCFEQ